VLPIYNLSDILSHTRRLKLPKAVKRARFEQEEEEMQMKIEHGQKLASLKKQATATQLLNEESNTKKTQDMKEDLSPENQQQIALPHNMIHHFFASHKKEHSVNGNSTETLARGTIDFLDIKYKLKGFFVSAT
jgi:hypothetical protein